MIKTNKKILFRADGNSATGLGHLYRLFALVEMLHNYFDTVFATSETSTLSVIPVDYELKIIPGSVKIQDEPKWLSECFNPSETVVIADGYKFDSQYQKQLIEVGFKLVYIDDLVSEFMFANIVVNHAVGVAANQYSGVPHTQFALGTEYAILRPEFLKALHNNRKIEEINNVFVCFGGADALNLTEKTVDSLLQFQQVKKINVVLGGAYIDKENSILNSFNERLAVYRNLSSSELVEVMINSQLAIVPSSTILYEVCAIKTPVISGFYVKNQEGIYNGFLQKGAITGLGDFNQLDKKELENTILEVLNWDANHLNDQIVKQSLLFDGKIVERYKKLIEGLC